ncbi:hypothetical protein QRX50_36685 [Amycolatopsis carbonis]|uniref:Uncharacterized protein n=1 Tax=Amycolatopsis carbonis TaxID=715471 RepID=A0A9Y2IBL7_9PSEU|nr:hypothetical protein [Amycolatopsis sp. 2-15]WIX76919.1 hypothetical protein QRX50_36685 [Amycolatopsis sp. 2-15]
MFAASRAFSATLLQRTSHFDTGEKLKRIVQAALTAAFVVSVSAFGIVTPASAAPCENDNYWCSGQKTVIQYPSAWLDLQTYWGADNHEHARGHGKIPENRWLYLDVIYPDGSYHGWVNQVKGAGTAWYSGEVYTGYQYDGPGYQVRACTDTAGVFTCTGWH